MSSEDWQTIASLADKLTTVAVLALGLVGLLRGWVHTPGRLREVENQRDDWRERARDLERELRATNERMSEVTSVLRALGENITEICVLLRDRRR